MARMRACVKNAESASWLGGRAFERTAGGHREGRAFNPPPMARAFGACSSLQGLQHGPRKLRDLQGAARRCQAPRAPTSCRWRPWRLLHRAEGA
jgi:hypothetical protein